MKAFNKEYEVNEKENNEQSSIKVTTIEANTPKENQESGILSSAPTYLSV